MKFFIDSADINEIREAVKLNVCDGVTTNPTLVAKTGRPFKDVIKDICDIVAGPISLEATALDADGLFKEASELSKIAPQVVVKIPMTREGLLAVKRCTDEGIKTNVTLVFSATQALLAAKAGASYVSPFIGRLDDISFEGMQLIEQILTIYKNYSFQTGVIVASVRNPLHVLQAAMMGADIATIPFGVVVQLFNHPLTDVGIARFLKDWEKVPK